MAAWKQFLLALVVLVAAAAAWVKFFPGASEILAGWGIDVPASAVAKQSDEAEQRSGNARPQMAVVTSPVTRAVINDRLSAIGTYDTLNPYTLRGVSAAGLGYLFESLMVGALDEAFTEYGLIAESVEAPQDRSWVAFTIRPEARFHDGKPITAVPVRWSP